MVLHVCSYLRDAWAEALNKFFIYSQKTGNDEYRSD